MPDISGEGERKKTSEVIQASEVLCYLTANECSSVLLQGFSMQFVNFCLQICQQSWDLIRS